MNLGGISRIIEGFCKYLASFCSKRRVFLISFILTTLFFIQSLKGGGKYAGFLSLGDNVELWFPQIANVIHQFRNLNFFGIDFYTLGGSSEFFLRPNLIIYNPFLLIASLIPFDLNPRSVSLLMVIILYIHAFLSCYFLQKLSIKFLKFDFLISLFIATGYTFSIYIVLDLGFFVFPIAAWLVPVVVYSCLNYLNRKEGLTLSVFAIILAYTSGYVVFSVFTIFISVIFILFYIFYIQSDEGGESRVSNAIKSLFPIFVASAIVLPLYLSILKFNKISVPFGGFGLKSSAHQFADSTFNIFRVISHNIHIDGKSSEMTLYLGVFFILLFVLLLTNQKRVISLPKNRGLLLNFSILIILINFLSSLGNATSLSDLFYYIMGPFGNMHIYQRYFIFTNLFLVLSMAVILESIIKSDIDTRRSSTVLFVLTVIAIIIGYFKIMSDSIIIKESFVFELLICFIFLLSFRFCKKNTIKIFAVMIVFLIPLDKMYDYSTENEYSSFKIKVKNSVIFEDNSELSNYFNNNSTKKIAKYIDLVPDFHNIYISKNYPWLHNAAGNKQTISSYYGYELHISSDLKYREEPGNMAMDSYKSKEGKEVFIFHPNVNLLKRTGADFIIYKKGAKYNDQELIKHVDLSDPSKVLALRSGIVVAPLKFKKQKNEQYNNGYIKILSKENVEVSSFKSDDVSKISLRIESGSKSSLEYLFWPNGKVYFYANDRRVKSYTKNDIMTIDLKSGVNNVEIRYENPMLTMFLVLYAIYFLALFLFILNYFYGKVGLNSFIKNKIIN